MNLYLVERTDYIDYDEFDACVVSAPRANRALWLASALFNKYRCDKIPQETLKISLLATNSLMPQGFVLNSFNAA